MRLSPLATAAIRADPARPGGPAWPDQPRATVSNRSGTTPHKPCGRCPARSTPHRPLPAPRSPPAAKMTSDLCTPRLPQSSGAACLFPLHSEICGNPEEASAHPHPPPQGDARAHSDQVDQAQWPWPRWQPEPWPDPANPDAAPPSMRWHPVHDRHNNGPKAPAAHRG